MPDIVMRRERHAESTGACVNQDGSEVIEKHQLAGVDERARGFNRLVEISLVEGLYRTMFRYEEIRIVTDSSNSQGGALAQLIAVLHSRGYSQLRSRLSFRSSVYLGSQEQWIEYPDPDREREPSAGWLSKLLNWLQSGRRSDQARG
jgi:hypothetical protein